MIKCSGLIDIKGYNIDSRDLLSMLEDDLRKLSPSALTVDNFEIKFTCNFFRRVNSINLLLFISSGKVDFDGENCLLKYSLFYSSKWIFIGLLQLILIGSVLSASPNISTHDLRIVVLLLSIAISIPFLVVPLRFHFLLKGILKKMKTKQIV